MQESAEKYSDVSVIDNIIDHISIVMRHYRLIIIIVLVSTLVTGFVSRMKPEIYRSKAVIFPVITKDEEFGLSNVDKQTGISMPTPSNVSELVSLLNSNILMENVLKNHNLFPLFFGEELEENPESNKIWKGIRYLKGIFRVEYNKKDNIIVLSAEYTDPKKTADILNYVIEELTDYMSSEAKRVADINKTYLESLINKNADPLIRQKIYSMIARQIEISMMAEVKENFAFKVLDPPRVPDVKVGPRIKKDIMFALVVSLFAGVVLAFLIELFSSRMRQRS